MAFPKLRSYVEGIELAPFHKAVSTGATNAFKEDAASVVGSLAVGFPEGLDPMLKADIQNSTLFAQLAANAKYDKTDQAKEWYNFYKDVLENVGWELRAFNWTDPVEITSYGSVDKLVLALAEASLEPAELKLLNRMVEALSKATNYGAQKILDNSSINDNKANFQVAIGGASGGDARLKLGSHIYSTGSNIVHVLFAKLGSKSVTFEYDSQSMFLNEQVYRQIRQAVIEKLGEALTESIADLTLS